MNQTDRNLRAGRLIGTALAAAAMAACGGGGGGDDGPLGDIGVTVANQDTLTRSAMVGLAGGLATDGLTLSGRSGVNAIGSRVRALAAPADGRKRAAALTTPVVDPCVVSGSTTTFYDDVNNNGTLDLNEPMTMIFTACRDDAQATDQEINGTLVASITAARSTGLTISVGAQAYTTTWTGHSVRMDGGFSIAIDTISATTERTVIGIGNALVLEAVTPVWTDRITLQAGYQAVLAVDTNAGSTSTTASGTVRSDAAGGYVTTRTVEPVVQFLNDPFPRSGRVQVFGRTGSLQATVLSTSLVQIDLDADGNGAYEASKTVGWDQIL